jgi:hypothetical protein
MKSHHFAVVILTVALAACAFAESPAAVDPKNEKSKVREGAFYEFRGRISDRNTLEKTFTLGWDKGSQLIAIAPDTKVFRYGRAARLEDAKSGDAVRGFGRVVKGKLVAVAVAFGDEGVELPLGIKIPDSITLPPQSPG